MSLPPGRPPPSISTTSSCRSLATFWEVPCRCYAAAPCLLCGGGLQNSACAGALFFLGKDTSGGGQLVLTLSALNVIGNSLLADNCTSTVSKNFIGGAGLFVLMVTLSILSPLPTPIPPTMLIVAPFRSPPPLHPQQQSSNGNSTAACQLSGNRWMNNVVRSSGSSAGAPFSAAFMDPSFFLLFRASFALSFPVGE